MKENFIFTLKEISEWVKHDSLVDIPALQRGLVWKPKQVELLWDSILRGFPIGSFMLSDVVDGQSKAMYYLMDGQQRFNAISLGFNSEKDANAMLWIDVNPSEVKGTTRVYWVKATTDAHPWGFHNNDDCTVLNTSEKRDAMSIFGLENKNIYNDKISIQQTWPYFAKCPIPLSIVLSASTDREEDFLRDIKDGFEKFCPNSEYKKIIHLVDNDVIKLYETFKRLKDYKVGCCHLPLDVMKKETEEDRTDQTTLEVLFNRINTGGTRISQDDLNYSAIKAYWPTIKNKNDELAKSYMNPSKLVMLSFRLAALLNINNEKWVSDYSIKQIRTLAKSNEKKAIENLYNDKISGIDSILKRIDEWLGVNQADGVPAILRTSIAYKSPDVYLLLMYFAKRSFDDDIEIIPAEIKALAFALHWFGNNKKAAAEDIYKRCKAAIKIDAILESISQSFHDCNILHVYSVEDVRNWYTNQCRPEWNFNKMEDTNAWIHFFNRIFRYSSSEAREMLLYAQRHYINTHFSNYDPARSDLWEDYNRPWDFDHIIPQDWVNNKRQEYRAFDQIWLNCIGNMAAISYEINRGKGNREEFEEYENNQDSLLFDKRSKEISSDLTKDKEQSAEFASITFDRFIKIYQQTYKLIGCLFNRINLSNNLLERKQLFTKIIESTGAKAYFATEGGKEYEVKREQDWAREWLGVGVVIGDYYTCLEWSAVKDENGNPTNVEIGIRKAPTSHVTQERRDVIKDLKGVEAYQQETNNDWWYYWRDGSKLVNDYDNSQDKIQNIIDEIQRIATLLEDKI